MRATRPIQLLLLAFLTAVLALDSNAMVGDWPQWRGPDGDNVSKESGWSPVGAEAPLWTAQVGTGYSSPAIADGRVIINGYFDDEETPGEGIDRISCLSVETGGLLWVVEYPATIYNNEHAGGALSSPTIVGDTVYVASRAGELRAIDVENGGPRWEVDLVERHGVDPDRYGFASSPYFHDGRLILNASSTLAIDAASGETLWISEDNEARYSTVAPIQLGERLGFVVFGHAGLLVLDGSNGELIHNFSFRKGERNVEGATPIVMGEEVFISSGYEQGGALVDFGGEAPELIWRTRRMRNKMAGSTLWEDHLYGFDESMLKCINLLGEEQWRVRGLGHGALTIADGHLLVTTSDGELIVAKAGSDGFDELSRRKVIDGGVFWAGPVLSDGRIFVRGSLGDLACMDHRGGDAGQEVPLSVVEDLDTELPSPEALVAKHLAACGLDKEALPGVRMSGKLYVKALGLDDVDALWELDAQGRWHARFALPATIAEGYIHNYFQGYVGWSNNPFRGGETLMEEADLSELRSLGGPRGLFQPLPAGAKAVTVGRESFHGVLCYRVDVELDEQRARQVYFDIASGRWQGRTSEKEHTVALGDWREVGGFTLPFSRTEFHPESGEEKRWKFSEIELRAPDGAVFDIPASVMALLREEATDEESDEETPEEEAEEEG